MLFKKLLLTLLFLNIYLNNFALDKPEDNESHVCTETECPLTGLFALDSILANPEVKEFYDNLADSEKTDFILLIKELNIVSGDILTKLVNILQKYENLVTKFREVNNYENLNMVITFTGTDYKEFTKAFDNHKFQEFVNSISLEEKTEFISFCREMQTCFKDGAASIANLFDLYLPLKNKYKNLMKKDILIVVGCDQDDALPCEYLVI